MVSPDDIAGEWRCESYFGYPDALDRPTSFVLCIKRDGTYRQLVGSTVGEHEVTGAWTLNNADLRLDNTMVVVRDAWTTSSVRWRIIDSNFRPGALAIYGGVIDDIDSQEEMKYTGSECSGG